MKWYICGAVLFALFSTPSLAFGFADIERCKAIQADEPRLACFDAVTAEVGEGGSNDEADEPSPVSSGDTGAWQIIVDIDPITDEKILTAAVESDARSSSFGKPVLLVRCKSKSSEAFIAWSEYLADETVVTVRIDESEPKSSSWSQSTDQTSTFAYQPADFLKSIREAKRLSARITPYRSGPVTANFPIAGLDAILTSHEDVCGVGKQ
jgi:hypothetical protein